MTDISAVLAVSYRSFIHVLVERKVVFDVLVLLSSAMGGIKKKFRSSRRKKRSQNSKKAKQCNDDIQTSSSNNDNIGDPAPSTSNVIDRKLSGKNPAPSNNSADDVQGNRFIGMDILAPVFHIFPCPNCFKKTSEIGGNIHMGWLVSLRFFARNVNGTIHS